jgi:hypothetical protein
MPEARLQVRSGSRSFPPLTFSNGDGWNEHVIRIPADALDEGATELTITGRYASFRYWFYQ